MEAILDQLARLLIAIGPGIVFATTFVETSFFVGLLVPAEAVVLFAAVLASAGKFSILSVLLATFFGALLGDQAGYLIGRVGGSRFVVKQGYIAKLWGWYQPIAARLFRRHPIFSVSMARFISFVRTLMPWFAGRDHMPYGRFLCYDFLGVLGWSSASVAVGYAAGESWRVVAQRIGSATAYILGGILAISLFIEMRRRVRIRMMNKRGITRVALTGNIAAGKSTVADVWRGLGAHIIDADVLARRAIQPGTNGFHEVVRVFGRGILSNGEIDRAALRQVVFADDVKRKQLEAIVHPEVARLRESEELRISATGVRLIVSDIPLLFETGLDEGYDIIVLVDAPADIRIERITRDRGLSEADAQAIVGAQMDAEEKRTRSSYVIENDGTREELVERAAEVWSNIVENVGT